MLNRRALLFRGSGLRRYAVADLWTLIQKVPKPDPAGALRSFQNAPQTHPIHTRDAILKFLDVVYEFWVYAPIVLIILELKQLTIDETTKTHLSFGRNKELGKWIYVFQPAIDKPNGFEVAGLSR